MGARLHSGCGCFSSLRAEGSAEMATPASVGHVGLNAGFNRALLGNAANAGALSFEFGAVAVSGALDLFASPHLMNPAASALADTTSAIHAPRRRFEALSSGVLVDILVYGA